MTAIPFNPPSRPELLKIRKEVIQFGKKCTKKFRATSTSNPHIDEWSNQVLNYWRCMEVPVALHYLRAGGALTSAKILDIGSPKIMAAYLAARLRGTELLTSDISDYFIADLNSIKGSLGLENLTNSVLDGRELPFDTASIPAAFSISVLEHIPEDGDSQCIAEIGRILQPGGTFVITVPYKHEYCEEFTEDENLYWKEHSIRQSERIFYQRRYSWETLMSRLVVPSGLKLVGCSLVGERPIGRSRPPECSGKTDENWTRFDQSSTIKLLRKISKKFGFSYQWLEEFCSRRYHYFSTDIQDRGAMNVILHLLKN